VLDIIINFRLVYRDSKTDDEIYDWKKIAIRYIFFGRFFIDFLASLPVEIFELAFGAN